MGDLGGSRLPHLPRLEDLLVPQVLKMRGCPLDPPLQVFRLWSLWSEVSDVLIFHESNILDISG